MVGPEAFTEVRYLAHAAQRHALDRIPVIAAEFGTAFGRRSDGLVRPYRLDGVETVVVALGSVLGTIKDAVDSLNAEGGAIGVLGITSYRPFPFARLRTALRNARRVIVIDRALAAGNDGMLAADVRLALGSMTTPIYTVIAGLGGRPITKRSLRQAFAQAENDRLLPLTFLDLDSAALDAESEGTAVEVATR
jgi:pyruvate ferredoxin oxidoreductase alpha subunit